jgi:hypothetical protein
VTGHLPFHGEKEKPKRRVIVLHDKDAMAGFHFSLAQQAMADGEVGAAIREYNYAVLYDPRSPELRLDLGSLLISQGALDEALVPNAPRRGLRPENLKAGRCSRDRLRPETLRRRRARLPEGHGTRATIAVLLASVQVEQGNEGQG